MFVLEVVLMTLLIVTLGYVWAHPEFDGGPEIGYGIFFTVVLFFWVLVKIL